MMKKFNLKILKICGFPKGPSLRHISGGVNTPNRAKLGKEWHNINWKKAEEKVKVLQEKITIATKINDMKEVYKLQWILLQTFEAKAVAIRRVVTNKGGKTSGLDRKIWNGPQEYWLAIKELAAILENPKKYKASPVKRVWIPKAGSNEKRPLGIPTMIDRAVQAIYHLCVDPAVETLSDPNSFGFRRFRSTHDAITAIRSLLDKRNHPHWIVEADISKCFDRIDHNFLMKNTPICHKSVLEQWLKAGVMEEMNFIDTSEGTSQGIIMSPTLCNIALNGIEKVLKDANPLTRGISPRIHVIRYADDMIITAKTKELALKNKEILSNFLAKRGLELNDRKTVITHIKEGFDFLGFNIKRVPWNPLLNKSTDQETVLIIKPSKKGITKLVTKIQDKISISKPIEKIIADLNPILRGWAEHKRISYHSQPFFIKLDHWIYMKMLKWIKLHKGSIRRKLSNYLVQTSSRKWNWGISPTQKIINLGEIPIIKMSPLKLDKNPYLIENLEYFNKRREKLIGAKFRAGKYSIENVLPLHEICHKQVTHGNKSLERFKITLSEASK